MSAQPERRELVRGLVAYSAGVVMGGTALWLGGVTDLHATYGSDLSYIWAGPRTILDGGNPYDAASWSASVERLGTQGFASPAIYSYPPPVALALLPIALVPLEILAPLWLWGGVAAAVLALGALLQAVLRTVPLAHAFAGAALLAAQPSVQTLVNAQWSFWLVAALCGSVLLLDRGYGGRAGALAAALLVKPQLFLIALPALMLHAGVTRGPRFAVALVGTVAAAAVLAAAASPSWWPVWAAAVRARAGEPGLANAATIAGDLLGPAGPWLALTAMAVAGLAALVRFGAASRAWVGVAVALSLAAAPYVRSYDQPLLIVALVLAAGALASRGAGNAALAVVAAGSAGVVVLSWSLRLTAAERAGSEAILGLTVVYVVVVVLAGAWHAARRDGALATVFGETAPVRSTP